ncbi:ABC transporter permease [Methanosarcina mazei]|uniref:ABC transporter permease n=2 Tax=Methanosarcina mazei TaxID=2209 RepID=A0A0F8I3U6_METMZ|nr:ABC transporter, permease protein [Methanosarcina mazei C16]KKG19266.1 ABC transporter permease [Methanosarcina mazei]KKG33401.1 ABC transporter permease [Methanosarcina mazei]KKG38014.1 ABC transporter permease [Methanosarcina mazei]KKG39238.1 ABC transporter permease [Methanosarcina mazei]
MIEEFSMAIRQLRLKKLRTLLILLGIAVGVATVVSVVSFGEGLRINAVEEVQKSRDLTLIEVSPGLRENGLVLIGDAKVEEIKKLGKLASPYIKDAYVSPSGNYFELSGIQEDYRTANELELAGGSWFESGQNQVVLGSDLWEKLEKTDGITIGTPLTSRLRLYGEDGKPRDKEVSFTPVGYLKPTGNNLDSGAFISLASAKELNKKEYYDGVLVKVESSSQVAETREQIEKLELSSSNAQDEIDAVNRIMKGVTLVLAFFSSISLIVGGLMVVSTMVVSVYERTREIGISKALGASESDILRMFLAECLFIGALGGILGDLFGVIFSTLIDRIGRALLLSKLEIGSIEHLTALNFRILAAGFLISLFVSVLSGLYPAWRASKMDPVRALKQL